MWSSGGEHGRGAGRQVDARSESSELGLSVTVKERFIVLLNLQLSRMEQWLSMRIYAPSVRTAQFEFLSRRSAWEIDTLQLMLLDKNGKPEKAAWLKHPKLV